MFRRCPVWWIMVSRSWFWSGPLRTTVKAVRAFALTVFYVRTQWEIMQTLLAFFSTSVERTNPKFLHHLLHVHSDARGQQQMSLVWSSTQHELHPSCTWRLIHPRLLSVRSFLWLDSPNALFLSNRSMNVFFPEDLLPHELSVCSLLTCQDALPNVIYLFIFSIWGDR